MGGWRAFVVALCGLVFLALPSVGAAAVGGPGDLPEQCVLEEGEMGSYVVVLHDWVEDPEVVALDQVARYGGKLGSVFEPALNGYSADFLPEAATALQAEPTVKYVSIDWLIWMDNSAGYVQWRSCPLAPPLGPKPDPPPPEEDETEPSAPAPVVMPPPVPASSPSADPADRVSSAKAKRCRKGKVKKGGRCVRKQRQIRRGA